MEIGIVGLGLIGGSLAIDLRRQGHTLLGIGRRPETCQQAIDRQIVDRASTELSLLSTAEVIFLCTPLHALATTVDQLQPHLSPTAILTDVGSVKSSVVAELTPKWTNFIGGHPMAGKAESGLEVAQADLFVDRAYVLTPTENTPPTATETIANLARSLNSRIYYCDPEEHDRAVAWISHLPVMISASLIAACLNEPDRTVLELAQKLASSGFRDTSRVGGGNPELGLMMACYNQTALLQSLHAYRQQLDQLIQTVEKSDWNALEQALLQTQQGRSQFSGTT